MENELLAKVYELRAQGLSQSKIAARLGMSQAGVSRLLTKAKKEEQERQEETIRRGRPSKPETKLNQLARSSVEVTKQMVGQEVVDEINALVGRMYSIEEIAAALQVTTRAVQGYLKNGKMRGVKVGGAWKVSAANLKRFMEGE